MRWMGVFALAFALACGDDDGTDDSVDAAVDAATDARPPEPDMFDPGPRSVTPTVGTEAIHSIDDRYLSVAVDTAQVVGGEFWAEDGTVGAVGGMEVPPYDFDRPALRAMARALAPATLRIGGSDADRVFYDMSDSPMTEAPEGFEYVFTAEQLDGVFEFATDVGFDVLFDVNGGPATRDADFVWQPDNARVLVEYVAAQGHEVDTWELTNEPNAFRFIHGFTVSLPPAQLAADYEVFDDLLTDVLGEQRIAGASSAFWPINGEVAAYFEEFLREGGADTIDVFTWHYYPQQSSRCPIAVLRAEVDTLLSEDRLDDAARFTAEITPVLAEVAPDAELWLGETGHSQCGGAPGLSNAFVGSFWWLDQLALLASLQHDRMVRQTLSGSDYGIIDENTTTPNPDYWASLLWRRHMGAEVLEVGDDDPGLRLYGHCAADEEGAVVLLAINLWPFPIDLELAGAHRTHLVEADELTSRTVRLNGIELALDGGALPELPAETEAEGTLTLPPLSYAFITQPDAANPACL